MGSLNQSHFTKEFCDRLIAEYGTARNAAVHIHAKCVTKFGSPASLITVGEWIRNKINPPIMGREESSKASRIEKLLEKANIPIESIGNIDKVTFSQWGYQQKDADGNPIEGVLDSTQITLTPKAPAFPVAQAATPNVIQFTEVPRILRKTYTIGIVSDVQAGFLKDQDSGELLEIHDSKAISIAQRIIHDIQPKKLVFIGDLVDFSFISRWQQMEEFSPVNESIQAGYDVMCGFIAAAGPQVEQKLMVGSNHSIRPERFLLEHNRMALRIRRASDASEWPVFSEGYLLRYEEHGIEYTGHFPAGEHYLLPNLVVMHAPPKAREFGASVIHGHVHKISVTPRVQHTHRGRETHFVYDVGALCHVGQNANKMSLMRTRTPSDQGRTNWVQGLGVVNVVEGKESVFSVDLIPIINHNALYKGEVYEA